MTYFSQLPPEKIVPISVGLLGFDGMTTPDLAGPLEAFSTARVEQGDQACYQPILIGVTNKIFSARSGATFKAPHTLETAPALDTIIIPGGAALRESEAGSVIAEWLLNRGQSARRIASVSTGIYPLAQSGLLDGRHVTTHWRYAQHVAKTFRRLQVDDAASFIKQERYYTSGGGTSGIEMSLALIEEDYGSKVALDVARELVVNMRPGGMGERAVPLMSNDTGLEERFAELPAWITSRLQANLSVEVLAERACLCPRHFSRLFKQTFNITPAHFVEQLRVSEAARRLSSRRLSVEGVAEAVGFRSADVFRRAFERRYGKTPRDFQKTFRGAPESAKAA